MSAAETLADLAADLHARLKKGDRFVRIGDVLTRIQAEHEAPAHPSPPASGATP